MPREEIDLLNEVQQPGHIHQAEERRGNGQDARGVAARHELVQAQAQNEDNENAGLETVCLGGRFRGNKPPGKIAPRAEDHSAGGDHSPDFEGDEVALFAKLVKFLQAETGDQEHDYEKDDVGKKSIGEERADDQRPEDH